MELFSFYLIVMIQPGILLMGIGIILILHFSYRRQTSSQDNGHHGGLRTSQENPSPVPAPVRQPVIW